MKALTTTWLAALLLLCSTLVQADLTIEITRGSDRATPIAIVPFAADGETLPEDVAQIISDDLERSGFFEPLPRNAMYDRPTSGDRKSTRLNSSHVAISDGVFCLKKKKRKATLCATEHGRR